VVQKPSSESSPASLEDSGRKYPSLLPRPHTNIRRFEAPSLPPIIDADSLLSYSAHLRKLGVPQRLVDNMAMGIIDHAFERRASTKRVIDDPLLTRDEFELERANRVKEIIELYEQK